MEPSFGSHAQARRSEIMVARPYTIFTSTPEGVSALVRPKTYLASLFAACSRV